jgi:F-type H+-transporting ATPase subunit b
MPQLDFSVFPSQLFWLTICFVTMLIIMRFFILPKTAEMIDLRKAKIDGDLARAAEIHKQVEEALERYNSALSEAKSKADVAVQKARDELQNTIERKQADLAVRLRAEIEDGERKIEKSKEKALAEVETAATGLAVDVLEKLGFSGIKPKHISDVLKTLK